MVWSSSGPPVLGADNVIRFVDVDHFLRELAGNLGRGRAFVRTRRKFDVQQGVRIRVEVPGVAWGIDAEAVVVFTRDGYVGLEFEDFEADVLPRLDRLGEEAAQNQREVPENLGERTIIAPMPLRELGEREGPRTGGAALVEIAEEDAERTGSMMVPPGLIGRGHALPRDPAGAEDDGDGTVEVGAEEIEPVRQRVERVRLPAAKTAPDPVAERVPTDAGPPPVEDLRTDEREPPPPDPPASPTAPEPVVTADLDLAAKGTIDLRSLAPAPPPAPAIAVLGAESLEDRALRLPRATAGGIVRVGEPADLLGWYLSELRHGLFTLLGGPEARVGEVVRIKLGTTRVLGLEGIVKARVGPWLTLELTEGQAAVADFLRESKESWLGALTAFGLDRSTPPPAEPRPRPSPKSGEAPRLPPPAAETVASAPPEAALAAPEQPPTVDLPPRSEPPRVEPARAEARAEPSKPEPPRLEPSRSEPRVEAPEPPRPEPARADPPRAEAPRVEPARPEPPRSEPAKPEPPKLELSKAEPPKVEPVKAETPKEDEGPPRLGRLHGDVVQYARAKDLKHELDTNVKNAGLFVESMPLPIRTHKSLSVQVYGTALPVRIEADVVFAAGGRVGFSVGAAADVREQLERALEALAEHRAPLDPGAHAPAPGAPGPTAATADLEAPPSAAAGADAHAPLTTFSGRLTRALTAQELVDLEGRAAEGPGDLAGASALEVFEFLARKNARGVLGLRSGEHKASLYFHEGSLAFLELSPFDEPTSIGRILIAQKKVTEPGVREALERARGQRRSVGRLLVALGHVQKKPLSDALREQVRLRMESIFGWKDGSYEWGPWREPPGDADLVLSKGSTVLTRHVRQRFEALNHTEIEALFGKNLSRVVLLREAPDTLVSALNLQQREVRFLEVSFAGDKALQDAVTASPAGRLTSLRLVATGLSLGIMSYKDGRRAASRTKSRAASGEKESPQIVQLRRELKERIQLLKGQNHFENLGVHWSAHPRSFRAAYEKARADLNVGKGPLRDAPPDVLELAREAARMLERAYGTLTVEQERIAYRKQLFDKTERQYSADMLVKQGEVALMRGDRVSAIEALETAVELDPSARNRALLAAAREGRPG